MSRDDRRQPCGLSALDAALAAAPTHLVSVDVFDTLLLRSTRPEFTRFADVAKLQDMALGAASPGRDRLLASRLATTRRAYQAVRAGTSEQGEVNFSSILGEMCEELGLAPACAAVLEQVEEAYEITMLSPNRRLGTALARLAATGLPVVATSDTPLSAVVVGTLLRRFHPHLALTRIYASSDVGCTKRDGGLYDHVCRHENVSPEHVLHVGDHPWSDCHMAQQRGLRALHLPRPMPWRWLHALRHRLARQTLRRRGLIP
ncbi:MAG: HAD-IA family hydrolase [Bacteroidota bacterium]